MLTTHIDAKIAAEAIAEANGLFLKKPQDQSIAFFQFLKSNSNVVLYGNPNLTDELNLFSILNTGRDETTIRPEEGQCSECSPDTKDPYQVFVSEKWDDRNPEAVDLKKYFLVASSSDYKEKFRKMFKEPIFRVKDNASENQLQSWKELLPETTTKHVIIADPYFFNEIDGYEQSANYLEFLKTLSTTYNPYSIIIFANLYKKISPLKHDRKSLINDIRDFGVNAKHIDVIHFEKEHDRHIFLSYHVIKPGGSLNAFFAAPVRKAHKSFSVDTFSLSRKCNFDRIRDLVRLFLTEKMDYRTRKILEKVNRI